MCQKLKVDDVLGVWPLHGLCGSFGGLACGIFGLKFFGGIGGVSFTSQLIGTVSGLVYAFIVSALIYGILKVTFGIRLTEQEEMIGPDIVIHHVEANPEEAL